MRGRVLLVAVCLSLAGCGERDAAPAPPRQATALASAPRLVGGGVPAFQRQLRALRGTPVVVNQWASWCGPCRYEFPFFRALAERYRGRVAFLGVDSQDGRDAAREFLRKHPVPYPSFFDPSVKIAHVFKGGFAWPTTAYYSRSGKLVETHSGTYASQAKLDADIRSIALGAG
jgi:cytochrome c biogenesis protein CcmG, thiol:disulfide interchange protein DsbE